MPVPWFEVCSGVDPALRHVRFLAAGRRADQPRPESDPAAVGS